MKLSPLLAGMILLASARSVSADDLLGTVSFLAGAGDNRVSYANVASITFELGYDGSPSGAVCVRHRVGCMPIPIAQAVSGAVFVFDPSNSPWFADVAGNLTDGIEQQLWYADRTFSATGTLLTGIGRSGATEAATFGVPVDFHGSTITSFRLTLDSFALGENSSCGGTPGGMCYQANVTWRIYGVPISTPARPMSWGKVRALYR